MTTLKDKIIEAGMADHILTDGDLNELLDRTSAARYGLVNKALKVGELIQIRRGLYIIGEKNRNIKLSKFYIASRIVPHSYVSLESAMSYYGWIPERVTTITNIVANGRMKKFTSQFGEFIYYKIPVNEYEFFTGVIRKEEISRQPYFIASPLRAITDFIYIRKIEWQSIEELLASLRIEKEDLKDIRLNDFLEIKRVYRAKRTLAFLEQLRKVLKK